MNELKLLNCPFCGGKAKYMEIKDFFILRFVTCTKCGIETPRNCLNRKEAIKRWNNRTPMANIVEKLEESQERYDDVAFMEMNTNGHTLDFEYAHGKKDGVQEAINIVKQEIGAINNEPTNN